MSFVLKRNRFLLALAVCVVSMGSPAFATDVADATIGVSVSDETVLVVDGGIGANTGAIFKQALNNNPKVKTILLNSGGGYVDVGLGMAELIANRGLSTWIPSETVCASICSALYFAGKSRMAQGQLGVHQVAMSTESNLQTQVAVSDMIDAFNRYDVDQKVFAVMLRTPPEQMYFLNNEEIVMWNVNRGIIMFAGERQGVTNRTEPLPDLFPILKSPQELFGDDQSILKSLQLDP
jgi:hypothetical protein